MNNKVLKVVMLFLFVFSFRCWYGFSHLTFSQDQARDVMLMHTYAENRVSFVSYGPKASVGDFYLPPLYYQIMFWSYSLTKSDLAMSYLTIFIESLTPILVFFVLRKVVSLKAAIVGFFIYLFGAQITLFGVSMWNPNMIPFLTSTLLLSSVILVNRNRSDYWIILSILSAVIAVHFHYQGVVLFPFLGVTIFHYLRQRRSLPVFMIGIFISCLTFFPYLKAESLYGWQNTKAILFFATQDHTKIYDRVTKPQFIVSFIPGFIERTLIGVNTAHFWLGRFIWFAGMSSLVFFSFRGHSNKERAWLLFYTVSILVMLRFYKGDKLDFYLGTLYLLPALLLAFVSHFNLKVGVTTAVVVMLMSGHWFSQQTPSNGYKLAQGVCHQLSLLPQPLTPLIHNNDLIQLLAYCSRTQNVSYSNNSQTIIDICLPGKDCGFSNKIFCTNYSENISRLYKQVSSYTQLQIVSNQQSYIAAGSVNNPVTHFGFTSNFYQPVALPNSPIPGWMTMQLHSQNYLY